jgi:hypothetical protein
MSDPSVSSVSGGVDVTGEQVSVGGDVTGRDKITSVQGDAVQGDKIVNYVQLDVQKLMETLKQALPDDDPLPANLAEMLRSFRGFHVRLFEWKEVHNVLNDVIFVFDQFSREVERRDASGQPGDLRSMARAWRPVKQKIDLMRSYAATLQHIGAPLIESTAGRQGPAWAIEILAAADRLADLLDDPQMNFAGLYDATCALSDAAEKNMYLADKGLRETAGELYNLSNLLLGSLSDDAI